MRHTFRFFDDVIQHTHLLRLYDGQAICSDGGDNCLPQDGHGCPNFTAVHIYIQPFDLSIEISQLSLIAEVGKFNEESSTYAFNKT